MSVRFSRRTAWDATPSPWARAALAPGGVDLTVSNPSVVGLPIDRARYAAALAEGAARTYEPNPAGLPEARRAIANYYAERGATVAPEQIFVTASTSEAYGVLFELLCDPGDTIAVPTPSYPLFDTLAELAGIRVERYDLVFDGASFTTPFALPPSDARAIVVVSPNNPTGHVTSDDTDRTLATLAAERGAALIVDEVFLDSAPGATSQARRADALRFTLSGLSKVALLPGAKLSWIVVSGPASDVDRAIERLEIILDARLSVAAPIQHALPRLLEAAIALQPSLQKRLETNRQTIIEALPGALRPRGGWSTIVRVGREDESAAMALLDAGVRVQPGFLYDLPFDDGLVLSTLVPESTLLEGLARMRGVFAFEGSDGSVR